MPIDDCSVNNEDIIEWSKECRLTWDDFQRESPMELGAETAAGIIRKFTDTVVFEREGKMIFQITCEGVLCYFNKKNSWVLEKQKTAPNQEIILKHEQDHFDIAEIYAREYWKEIQKLCEKEFVCLGNSKKERKTFSEKEGKKLLDIIEKRNVAKWITETEKYEDITDHGLIEDEQLRYLDDIEQRLQD